MFPLGNFVSGIVAALAIAFAVFQAQPAPPQSPILYQWETIDGKRTLFNGKYSIFYKDIRGRVNNSETLVVLHGFPTSSFDFYLMISGLRDTFERIILLDFLGYGFSDKPRDHEYSIMEQADIVEHVFTETAITDFHILAHDYGDTVAQELLARELENGTERPRRFRAKSTALLNGGLFPSTHHPVLMQHILRTPFLSSVAVRFANRWLFGRSLNQVFGEHQLNSMDIKQMWYFARHKDGYRVWPRLLTYIDERQTHETRWTDALQRAKRPVCVFYGPADPVNPPPGFVDHYKKIIPRPCVEVFPERVGHYPQLEDPQLFIEKYAAFLRNRVKMNIDPSQLKVLIPEKLPEPEPITE